MTRFSDEFAASARGSMDDYHGEIVSYTETGESPASITCMFTDNGIDDRYDDTEEYWHYSGELSVKRSNIANPIPGEVVTVNSVAWDVMRVMEQDDERSVLELRRSIRKSTGGIRQPK